MSAPPSRRHPQEILLLDLPTFPKGVLPLTFPAIAACFPDRYRVRFVDLNLDRLPRLEGENLLFAGLKVSCQNHHHARALTKKIKAQWPRLPVVWGGEYPSLLPEAAASQADSVVRGALEPVAGALVADLEAGRPRPVYAAQRAYDCSRLPLPDYSIITAPDRYLAAMGYPLETSRGCDRRCTFCMVHTMQPTGSFKPAAQLDRELARLPDRFVNVVDYNLGADRAHLEAVVAAFARSRVRGWMGELCLETLDDDALLARLARSRCRAVYCGLESVSPVELRAVNKERTNHVAHYERIVRRVQAHGIQVGAGVIVGLPGASARTLADTFGLFERLGLLYAKVTFLTFNPGTRVHRSMERKGRYDSSRHEHFDGNHLSFHPTGLSRDELLEGLGRNLRQFYSAAAIRRRARAAGLGPREARGFFDFNLVYREPYLQWLRRGVFESSRAFESLLATRFRKSLRLRAADAGSLTLF